MKLLLAVLWSPAFFPPPVSDARHILAEEHAEDHGKGDKEGNSVALRSGAAPVGAHGRLGTCLDRDNSDHVHEVWLHNANIIVASLSVQ